MKGSGNLRSLGKGGKIIFNLEKAATSMEMECQAPVEYYIWGRKESRPGKKK